MATLNQSQFNYLFLLLSLHFLLISITNLEAHKFRRRVYAYQREVPREEQSPPSAAAADNKAAPSQARQNAGGAPKREYLICNKGKPIAGICVCEQGYVGKFCERQMHCLDYGRMENGSCLNCTENFTGPNCDHPKCENGGVEVEIGQTCKCEAPYSGPFCNELRMEDVYYFYNSKAAIIGPLGILLIVPMIICFVMCEKHARRRQVNRIQKAWGNEESSKKKLDGKRIENLLKEKDNNA